MELIYNQANWYPVTNKQSKPRGILPAMAGGSARKGSFFQWRIYGYIKAEVLSDQFATVFTDELNLLI